MVSAANKNTVKSLAVVTGASSGIGYALARQFVQHDFDVIVAAEDEGIQKAAETLAAGGATVKPVQVDLATREGVETLYKKIKAEKRPVDSLALNAGVGVNGDFARDTDLEAELNLISLNVLSTVHLAKLLLKDMTAQKHGRVLITASIAAMMPGPFTATYNASKSFLLSFAEAVRSELKDSGVTITALMPGAVETNFFRRAGMDDTKLGASEKDNADDVARDGFEALMAGKDKVVAHSAQARFEATMGKILSPALSAAMGREESRPGSAKK